MAFQGYLLQSTGVTIQLGAFVDKTDGVTYETGLATAMNHATTGIRISKNGAALTARNTATEPTYDAFGYYRVSLDATDVGTLGRLELIYADPTTTLQCEADFDILPANVYNAKYGTGYLDVAVAEMANIDFGVLQKASLDLLVDGSYKITHILKRMHALLSGSGSSRSGAVVARLDVIAVEANKAMEAVIK